MNEKSQAIQTAIAGATGSTQSRSNPIQSHARCKADLIQVIGQSRKDLGKASGLARRISEDCTPKRAAQIRITLRSAFERLEAAAGLAEQLPN